MDAALQTAARRLGVECDGAPVWGDLGSTLSRRAGDRWLRVFSTRRPDGRRPDGEGIVGAEALVPDDVPRPRLHGSLDWATDGFGFGADLLDFVQHPVISPHRPDLDHDPGLPDQWWSDLRGALTGLGKSRGVRTTVRDAWFGKAFPQFLGIPAPAEIERVTGHGDLHWGNLTAPLVILDWERWGLVPVGYDPGILYVNSLLVPEVAARVRTEFADVLDTPAGRIGELAALAEMLQAVARGYYPELAHLLVARAVELTGVQPPIPVSSEIPA
ncbi:hypothetical protein ACFYNO_29095 [Kitasatospora sp. NPDC006697]|uniref:hypothetical protein n=1 Tax=Kitasatospora sp. NPDC006697 TaxID=3364020 RepID=UPI0036CF129B